MCLGAVGNNEPRSRLYELGLSCGLAPLMICHPQATLSSQAEIGAGSVVLPGSVINAGAKIGANVILNTGAIVEHDCQVGDHAHIASGAVLGGGVRVGRFAHVGAGSTVRQGILIGEGATVGVGAAVVTDVEPWSVVVGVPARKLAGRPPGSTLIASPSGSIT